ncbi:MAG: beta-galactosidase, partial [Clostridia bacterium]|nr:beta-galactosidase [Clostridia bacterium]
ALQGEPNIIGWQIDNEIYPYRGCYCPLCKKGFGEYLQNKYKTVEALNDAWGTARWSLAYKDFDDVIPPREDTWNHPSLYIEWIAYHSDVIVDYVEEQAEIIKRYFSVPVGTDMMPLMEQNYYKTNRKLDVVQFNHYETAEDLGRASFWCDFARPIKDRPFWVTETQLNWNGSECAEFGYRPKGNAYINTWLPIAKGGKANMYWHWRQHYAGHELVHGAVLSTSGRFCFNANEVKQAGKEFKKCEALLFENKVSSAVALHFSATAWLNLKHVPVSKGTDYLKFIADRYHKALRHHNVDLIDTPHGLDGYKLLISPYLSCVDEHGLKERIMRWVKEGGTWVVGPLSDIMTDAASKYRNAPYSFLEEFAGVYTAFQMPIANDVFKAKWSDGTDLSISQTFDGYQLCGSESMAVYTNDHPQGLSVITRKKVGKGQVVLVGAMLGEEDFKRLIEKELGFAPICEASDNVELIERGSLIFALELKNEKGFVCVNRKYKNVLTGEVVDGRVEISPYSVCIFQPCK